MNELKGISAVLSKLSSITPKSEAEVLEQERRLRDERLFIHYRQEAPERFVKESLGTYKVDDTEKQNALANARLFVQAVKCGKFQTLVFLGNVGTGKTHLSCGIIRECGGLYRLASSIVEELRRAKSFSSDKTEAKILDAYGKTNLLIIDEIGRGATAAEEQYMLYQIINERYNRRMPTVLVSNQIKKEFLQYIGIAAADRLSESAHVVELTGKSYRAALRQS
ncbi:MULTISPECIES: ATP-binding protein [unclassified Treponema]|uniref:ATP-binding protein n=1 Tax=unclassified Treponema TaxID=2638727 RepID=UPI0020A58C10|nr:MULTISPECIES: ATP-binding protein [unclassified Treponema]UTC65997.1 ATP-binding protein [Treponema sp. OMZ 789]UTC68727.1 ATP-binding protein [Treponema sp. OMZ 790]UTC71456.1 ATP-binding protein [Treponema sp. OMZ 791]